MNKPFLVLAASAAATIGAMLLAIRLTMKPEEGPKDSRTDDLLPEDESGEDDLPDIEVEIEEEPADGIRQPEAVIVTESGMRLKSEIFNCDVYTCDEVSFQVTTCSETAIGFSICNTGAPLYYDPHIFPVLQYKLEDEWHELELNSFPITRDLRVEEIPAEPTGMLLDAALYYTRVSQPGLYRMVAEVYTTIDGFMKADPNDRLYYAAEFRI